MSDAGLPVGTVTFLFTDVVGSTALWEQAPGAMGPAMDRHDVLVDEAVTTAGGKLVRPRGEGDSRFAVFTRASDALASAVAIQRALAAEAWSTPKAIVVRISVHTGEADLREGDYYGSAVNRCARLRSLAHPGQILVSHATADLAGHTITLRDLGTHRLKDLTAPEHVHQVEHPDIASDFPPLVSIDVVPHNLPVQLTELVGRTDEVGALVAKLAGERLVTLTGMGGTGKSRLALAIAAEVFDRFPDGVWFVELAAIADPELVAPTIAATVADIEDTGDAVAALTRTLADKHVLLVVDNCEHVVDAVAKLADAVLRSTTDARILATSQQPLNITGEVAHALGSLAADDALALFCERARAANSAFTLDAATEEAARAICSRLDNIPLALELAATRTRGMTAAQIAERLDDRFRLLTGGSRAAPERHRTLAAALDWAHDLLTEPERLLYRRLAIFNGGATLDAIEAVCPAVDDGIDPFDLYDLLQNLVDRSLVVLDATFEPPRYRMLETILAHARNRLPGEELHALRAHHLEFFAAQAARGRTGLRTDYAAWFKRLHADLDNLRAALAWSLEGGDPVVGLHAAAHSAVFWSQRGLVVEAARWYSALLDIAPGGASADRALALGCFGHALAELGRGDEAIALLTEAVAMATAMDDPTLRADLEYILGVTRIELTGSREGLDELIRALEVYERTGDEERASVMKQQIADTYLDLDLPGEALPHYEALQRWATAHQDDRRLATNVQFAAALIDLGDIDGATAVIASSGAATRRSGAPEAQVLLGVHGATVLAAVDDHRGAATLLADAARRCLDFEAASYLRSSVLVGAATLLAEFDREAATWLAAAVLAGATNNSKRLPPRLERLLADVDAAGRDALGEGYDTVWRQGTLATTDEVNARVLGALAAVVG